MSTHCTQIWTPNAPWGSPNDHYAFNNLHEQKSVLVQLTHTSNEIQHEPNAYLANRIIRNGIKPNRIIYIHRCIQHLQRYVHLTIWTPLCKISLAATPKVSISQTIRRIEWIKSLIEALSSGVGFEAENSSLSSEVSRLNGTLPTQRCWWPPDGPLTLAMSPCASLLAPES